MALSSEVVEELSSYRNSLQDLTVNSKPLINMLTMLAEEYEQHAGEIVRLIEDHIKKCKPTKKLPVLYLIDSIVKNLGSTSYKSLFMKNIVQTFTSVFEQVDEKTRSSMFKLRQTWTTIMPNPQLYQIDVKIKTLLDPAWPVTATPPQKTSIYVNPKFLSKSASSSEWSSPEMLMEEEEDPHEAESPDDQEVQMRKQLIAKQQELLQLKQARLELELAEAQEKMKLHKKQASKATTSRLSSLPLPTIEAVDDFDEIIPAPSDPRPRPPIAAKPRDPRLKKMEATSTDVVSSTQDIPQIGHGKQPHQPVSGIPHSSASFAFSPAVSGQLRYSQVPVHSRAHQPHNSQAYLPPYNGIPTSAGSGMQMPFIPPVTGDSFSGEVFNIDVTPKFSDEDSDSSRSSSIQFNKSQNTTISRDPRLKESRDPRVSEESRESSSITTSSQSKSRNSSIPSRHHSRSSSKSHGVENKDRRSRSPIPRTSNSGSIGHSSSGSRNASLSASNNSSSGRRSTSKEKDVKNDSKSKDLKTDKPKSEEKKRSSTGNSTGSKSPKCKDSRSDQDSAHSKKEDTSKRLSKDREKSPAKSPKSSSSKSSLSKSFDKKDVKSEDKRSSSKSKSSSNSDKKVKSSHSDTAVKSKHGIVSKSKSEEKEDSEKDKGGHKAKQEKRSFENEDTSKKNKKLKTEEDGQTDQMDTSENKDEQVDIVKKDSSDIRLVKCIMPLISSYYCFWSTVIFQFC